MSENKLTHAKELIQQKRYDEARTLLKTINHPTAARWLIRLDEIDPPESMDDEIVISTETKVTNGGIPLLGILATLTIIVLAIIVMSQQIRLNNLSRDVDELISVVNSHASDINTISRDLRRVSVIANNADRHAHSHGFSDTSLKTDITTIEDPLDRILSIRGVRFTWNSDAYPDIYLETGQDYGVLAQDVRETFPELVTENAETGLLSVDYTGLIPILIEAVRAQQQQIDSLRSMMP